MIRNVVVINGKPRSGKDTFCRYLLQCLGEDGKSGFVWSTVEKEKEILKFVLGREYDADGPNSEKDRAAISDLKKIFNSYYSYTLSQFSFLLDNKNCNTMVVHSREGKEIDDMRNICYNKNINFFYVYIHGKNERESANQSDRECSSYRPKDIIEIYNTESLMEYEKNVRIFCKSQLF